MKFISFSLWLGLMIAGTTGFAQVNGPTNPVTSTYNFMLQTQRLDQMVGTSPLAPLVRPHTLALNQQSTALYQCVSAYMSIGYCEDQMTSTAQAFSILEGYLVNSQQAYPQIYNQYLVTKSALFQVESAGPGGPPPPPPLLTVMGTMNTNPYDFQARDQTAILTECLQWASQRHITTVSQLTINRQTFNVGAGIPARTACQTVGSYAHP